jgi:hypothetical protein
MQVRNRKFSKSVKRHAEKCRMADGNEGQCEEILEGLVLG